VKPNKIIINEKYRSTKKINDIALIRLEDDLVNINKICLPIEGKQDIEKLMDSSSTKLTIAGWGQTENSKDQGSDVLMQAHLDYLPREECSQKFSDYAQEINSQKIWSVTETQICAIGNNGVDT
jgi:secreted trypsin-like serine protease